MDMVMLPVFPSRRFMHPQYSRDLDAGITRPEDLTGKRCVVIGSNQLQPNRVPSTPNVLSNRLIGLASGGAVACANPARSGS